jgi:hypothetical protein
MIYMEVIRQYHDATENCIGLSFIIFSPPNIINLRWTGHIAR